MKIIVGAPVADRDWILPAWFECLQAQTQPPDEYVFVVHDPSGDTRRLLHELGPEVPKLSYAIDTTRYIPRYERNFYEPRFVYGDFAERRNALLRMARKREPDIFVSLDTDLLLEDETALERLIAHLEDYAVASPCTYLHPAGARSECFNAALWVRPVTKIDPEQAWYRLPAEYAQGRCLIDVPMAALAMCSEVLDCKYHWHRQGEDFGFAQELALHGHECVWDPSIQVRHVMQKHEVCPAWTS